MKKLMKNSSVKIRGFILLMIIFQYGCSAQRVSLDDIPVTVDPRVELMSTICRLAGFQEYNMNRFPAYTRQVEEYFGPYKDHEAIKLMQKLRSENSIGYNAPMGLAVYVKDIESMDTRIPFDQVPEDLDKRWNPEIVSDFLAAAAKFAEDSRFMDFFASQKVMYDTAVQRFESVLHRHQMIPWFEEYFQTYSGPEFILILGMQNGGANYGARTTLPGQAEELYSIMGCWEQDEEGLPVFADDRVINTVVHEFCHSFTNPMVDQFKTELKESGERIYKEVEVEMSKLAYGSWKTMMYESLVRACVIRYLDQKMGREAADKQLASDTERGFRWMAELEKQLLIYENNRREFRAFDDFMPVLVDWFEELGGRMDEVLAEYRRQQAEKWEGFKEKGPKVVSSVPTIGATDVDPGISEIIITFDRKMYPYGFEINDPEASEEFSNMEITEFPRFSEDSLQLIIPVKLEAGKKYKCILNSFAKGYFRDANEIPLYPVEITFTTAKK